MKKTPVLFDLRNEQKKIIEFSHQSKIDARIGEFWWYREGVNIGNEISKDGYFMRACLILQNDLGNGLLLVTPITTKYHAWMKKRYIKVDKFEKYGLKECWLIMNQTKMIDKKRLVSKTKHIHPLVYFAKKVKHSYWEIIQ